MFTLSQKLKVQCPLLSSEESRVSNNIVIDMALKWLGGLGKVLFALRGGKNIRVKSLIGFIVAQLINYNACVLS
jgi:hypothetical protein